MTHLSLSGVMLGLLVDFLTVTMAFEGAMFAVVDMYERKKERKKESAEVWV